MTGLQCASGHCTDGVCCDTDGCSHGQRCDIFGVEGSCSDQLDVDGACGKTTDCLPGLLCVFDPFVGSNICNPPVTPTPTLFPTLTPPPTEIIIVRTRRSCEEHPCAPGLICLFDPDFESKVCDCGGDCNDDFAVTVDELLTMVGVALDETSSAACRLGDLNGDMQVTIDEILTAVNNALEGCSVS